MGVWLRSVLRGWLVKALFLSQIVGALVVAGVYTTPRIFLRERPLTLGLISASLASAFLAQGCLILSGAVSRELMPLAFGALFTLAGAAFAVGIRWRARRSGAANLG